MATDDVDWAEGEIDNRPADIVHTVRVSGEVAQRLEEEARRQEVTPSTLIERMLNHGRALCQQITDLKNECAEYQEVLGRLEGLLIDTAKALKGEPGALVRHDWSDLPAVARKVAAEAAARRGEPTP